MAVYNEADFVMQGREVQDPEIAKDELELYYDVKGKKNGDIHKNKLLDMSGQGKDGELTGFDYDGELSGYDGDNGLVFDGIEDTLKMPKLSGIDADNFTYQLNNNMLAFSEDEVKTVKNGNIEIGGRNLISRSLITSFSGNMDASEYVSKGVIRFSSSSEYGGVAITAHPLLPNTEYVMSYRYKKTSGTLVSFGGHTDYSWEDNKAYVDGVEGGEYSVPSSVFVADDDSEHGVVIYINTPSEITVNNLIYIQPNRGNTTPVDIDIYDLKLEKGTTSTSWTPAPEDLLETTELKGNILGDMEDIVDASPRDSQSGKEVFTEHADDSHVEVEVDGKSYQHAKDDSNNLLPHPSSWSFSGGATFNIEGVVTIPSGGSIRVDYYWDGDTATQRYGFEVLEGKGRLVNTQYFDVDGVSVANTGGVHHSNGDGTNKLLLGEHALSMPELDSSVHRVRVIITVDSQFGGDNTLKIRNLWGGNSNKIQAYEPPAPSPDYPIEIESVNGLDVVSSVGGRNLIQGSEREVSNTSNILSTWGMSPNLKEGNRYTFSFDIKSDTPTILGSVYLNGSLHSFIPNTFIDGEWKRFYFSFTFKKNDVFGNELHPHFYPQSPSTSRTYVRNQKIEEGETEGVYSPSPEDITQDTNHPLIDKTNLSLSEPLRSVDTAEDRLFRDSDGLWKIERSVGERILDGTENWGSFGATTLMEFSSYGIKVYSNGLGVMGNIKSSHFPETSHFIWDDPTSIGMHMNGQGASVVYFNYEGRTASQMKSWAAEEYNRGTPLTVIFELATPTIEILSTELQDKLNNIASFKDSNYVYTVQNTDNPHKEQLKPTLHATFKSKDYLKETRTLTNLLIWARELTDEELIHHNKLFLNRFNLPSDKVIGEPIEQTLNLLHGGMVGHSLEQNYKINI